MNFPKNSLIKPFRLVFLEAKAETGSKEPPSNKSQRKPLEETVKNIKRKRDASGETGKNLKPKTTRTPRGSLEKRLRKASRRTLSEFSPKYSKKLEKAFAPELKILSEEMKAWDSALLVDGANQTIYAVKKTPGGFTFKKSYLTSTAKKGLGGKGRDKRTPLGLFSVEKIIKGAFGEIIKEGHTQGKRIKDVRRGRGDPLAFMTTSALRLKGEEEGVNDRASGYHVHGTNFEDRLGKPASGGCLRTSNKDILEITRLAESQIEKGPLYVYITGRQPFPDSKNTASN